MDSDAHKHFRRFLMRELKETTHQLFAHIVVAHLAEEAGFPFLATVKCALASPEIQRRVDERVAGLDELVEGIDDLTQHHLIQEYLAKVGPGETTN